MEPYREYQFSVDLLGDLQRGRPNSGPDSRLAVYRRMQNCVRDVAAKSHGTREAGRIFYQAGFLAGQHCYANLIGPLHDLNEFLAKLQGLLRELKIGVLRMEEVDLEQGHLVVTVAEDLDCAVLPERHYEFCTYDEGFVAALMESFTSRKFVVKEIDCWCSGDRTCRFSVQLTE